MKPQTDTFWTTMTGGFFASVAYLMGGVDNLLVCLAFLMVIDYATGVMVGYFDKEVSSQRAFKGIAKKIAMLLFIMVANQVDLAFGADSAELRNYIIILLIATEGISLTENFGKLGLPIPTFWLNALEAIKGKAEQGGSSTDFVKGVIQKHEQEKGEAENESK